MPNYKVCAATAAPIPYYRVSRHCAGGLQLPSPAAGSSAARPTTDGNAGAVLNMGIVLWLFCTQYSLTTDHVVFALY